MSSSIKDKAADVGDAISDAAKSVKDRVVGTAEKAGDWVKDKAGMCESTSGAANVRERMDVIASCGKKIGVVDHIEGDSLKLTKNDSPDGQHHYIPSTWVDHVDSHVHLSKNSMEAEKGWKADAASCGCS